jgi:hypothetical protein
MGLVSGGAMTAQAKPPWHTFRKGTKNRYAGIKRNLNAAKPARWKTRWR